MKIEIISFTVVLELLADEVLDFLKTLAHASLTKRSFCVIDIGIKFLRQLELSELTGDDYATIMLIAEQLETIPIVETIVICHPIAPPEYLGDLKWYLEEHTDDTYIIEFLPPTRDEVQFITPYRHLPAIQKNLERFEWLVERSNK